MRLTCKLFVLTFVGLMTLASSMSFAKAKVEKVVVTGVGVNEQGAIKNATKAAVQQIVGKYVVSDAVMKNRELIKDQVLSQSNAFVRSFKVLNKSKDDDGLFEVEAEVEVEVGRLTNKLGELNIAIKNVGTDEFFAVSLDKFDSSKDFKAMADRIIFEPLRENKKVYDIKIIKFAPLDDYEERQIEWIDRESKELAAEGVIKPFRLIFSVSFNKDYIDSVTQFLEKASKKVSGFYQRGENYIYLAKIGNEFNKRKYDLYGSPTLKVIKSYELTSMNYKTFKSLHLKFCKDYQAILATSLLDENDMSIITTSYFGGKYNDVHISRRNSSVGPENTLNISYLQMKATSGDPGIWGILRKIKGIRRGGAFNIVTGLDSHLYNILTGTYKNPQCFVINTRPISFVMYLGKSDVQKIKNLKIELMWLRCKLHR